MSYRSPWRNSSVIVPTSPAFSNAGSPTKKSPPRPQVVLKPLATSLQLPPGKNIFDSLESEPLSYLDIPSDDNISNTDDVCITNQQYLASYNWVSEDIAGMPTILVPGSPPYWQNRPLPYTIPPDRGFHVFDLNSQHFPKSYLLPLFAAVHKMEEKKERKVIDWASVDIVTDRNNLRKLTRWASQAENCRDFRIDMQLAGEATVLMGCWSERYAEIFGGRTYGYSFEKESTIPAPGCHNSSSHHRIIAYDMNGLKLVVRFEVDCCIRPPSRYPRKSNIDDLTEKLSEAYISQSTFRCEHPIVVCEGGSEVSAASIIEVTTRSEWGLEKRGMDWKEAYHQLFFSQTPHHYLGVHKFGKFIEVQKRRTSFEELQQIETEMQITFKKVRSVLDSIKKIALETGKGTNLSLVCKDGRLGVYRRSAEDVLIPLTVLKFFDR